MAGLRLYRRLLGADLRSVLEYRLDALILIAAAVVTQLAGVLVLLTVFTHVPALAGWTRWEVLTCYSLVVLAEGIGSLFFDGMWQLANMINYGTLDHYLVRPYPVLLQVTGASVGLNGLGNTVLGLALLATATANAAVPWSVPRVGWALLLVCSAALVKLALNLTANTASFWLVSPTSALAHAVHAGGELSRYPSSVYGVGVRTALTMIPLAFVGYFPAAALLDKGVAGTVGAFTPLVAAVWAGAALWCFRTGLRRYDSAGG